MNPWVWIFYGLGYAIILAAAIFVIAFIIASIKVVYDRAKKKKQKPGGHKIFSSGD